MKDMPNLTWTYHLSSCSGVHFQLCVLSLIKWASFIPSYNFLYYYIVLIVSPLMLLPTWLLIFFCIFLMPTQFGSFFGVFGAQNDDPLPTIRPFFNRVFWILRHCFEIRSITDCCPQSDRKWRHLSYQKRVEFISIILSCQIFYNVWLIWLSLNFFSQSY